MRRRRLVLALVAVAAALAATALPLRRLRYLALPLASDPSVRATPRPLAVDDAPLTAAVTARVPGRVSALLPLDDGSLWVATFDAGLYRCAGGRVDAVGALDGRERFVDALLAWDGHVVAATHRGAVVLDTSGARVDLLAAGDAVSSLLVVDGELVLGTAHGLWRARSRDYAGERGPDGEPLRATALAAAAGRLFVGTPSGVYSIAPDQPRVARPRPLVFGSPPASTNVVTALVPLGDGVVAGTDDGGLVLVDDAGVHAASLGSAAADEVSPGALVRVGGGVVVATQAGLFAVTDARARRLWHEPVSAVAARDGRLFFGDDAGRVYATAASRIFWMSAS